MQKDKLRNTLLRLVEAGQLARVALLVPLVERGLEPGDEVVLAALAERPALPRSALADVTGAEDEALAARVARLAARDLLATDDEQVTLTERGQRLHAALASAWAEMERDLLAGLDHKRLKSLDKSLRALLGTLKGGRAH